MPNPSPISTPRPDPASEAGAIPSEDPLRVVHETPRFVVVDKPSGLLSVPGRSPEKSDCVRARVAEMYPRATGPMTVHRLDLETSGLLVLALDPAAHRELSLQFEKRRVRKRYIALVEGDPGSGDSIHTESAHGKIRLPLSKDWPNRPRQKVDFEQGKPAVTRFRVLKRFGHATRVELVPITGRSHQLRVHAAHELGLGAPIVGDPLYGDASLAPRMMLHATRLELTDPGSGEPVVIESEAPF